jgi:hypothetical protein
LRGTPHLVESGVYGESEIGAGVYERAIEIKDQDANVRERRGV